ncbi:MAG: response regulator [Anaerolineae bacterium]
MAPTQILIVEDESIVALDLKNRLKGLGYGVPAIVASGEGAIAAVEQTRPDLVLMDINLKGAVDGVTAAGHIRARLNIPTVYLTAFADDATLQRAKIAEPFGYLLKPFDERELAATIKMALYKHKTDQALKESEHWLSTTLKSIGEGVIATDAHGCVKFMNPIAEALTGLRQPAALEQDIAAVFKVFDEQSGSPTANPALRALKKGSAVKPAVYLLQAAGGQTTPIDTSAAPIKDNDKNVIGAVLVFRDISAERAAEQRIRQQERLAVVGQLASGIAHDFNNILTGMIGFAELLQRRPDLPTGAGKQLSYIVNQGRQAAHLIRQILDFSRQSVSQSQPIELVPFLEESLQLLKRTIPENIRIELAVEPDPQPYMVSADPAQIQQSLTNLALNARDAMPTGGMLQFHLSHLSLPPGQPPPVPDLRPGEWISLAVSDTGTGISPDVLPHVLEPFFTTKDVGEGTGLGLSQVYGIIKQHGGCLDIKSTPGERTTFTLYLPALLEASPASPPPTPAEAPRGQGELLLLVEDDPGVLEATKSILQYLGYRVLAAAGGPKALKLFDRRRDDIALVLTDLTMPRMSGAELSAALAERDPDVKIIALSGYIVKEPDHETLGRNVIDRLQKPLNLEQLAHAVHRALAASSMPELP